MASQLLAFEPVAIPQPDFPPECCRTCSSCQWFKAHPEPTAPSHPDFPRYSFVQGSLVPPRTVPARYHSDDLVEGIVELYTHTPNAICDIQAQAAQPLWTWFNCYEGIDTTTLTDLEQRLNLLDDYFFCGILKRWIAIRWVDEFPGNLRHNGQVYRDPQDETLHIIEIRIPQEVQVTGVVSFRRFQRLVGTLLHEMTHAAFDIYMCRCCSCSCLINMVDSYGIEGHGPSFRDLGRGIEDKMNNLFRSDRLWYLNVADGSHAHIQEINARIDHGFSEWQ